MLINFNQERPVNEQTQLIDMIRYRALDKCSLVYIHVSIHNMYIYIYIKYIYLYIYTYILYAIEP